MEDDFLAGIHARSRTSQNPSAKRPDRRGKKALIWIILAVVIAIISVVVYLLLNRHSQPAGPAGNVLTSSLGSTPDFPLFYPSKLPTGYTLQTASIGSDLGIVYFQLTRGDAVVYVSEQAAPAAPPDFQKIQDTLGFKKIDTQLGDAVIGSNNGLPAAILLTNTTQVNLNGSKSVPSDVLIALVKEMRSL